MTRSHKLLLIVGLMLIVGCPSGDTASVEHDNVCIDLSADGKTVIFSSADGDLYLFDIASKTARRLTETTRIESYPSFLPDGTKAVFSAYSGERSPSHIFLMDLSDLTVQQLTDDSETSDILPRFRPDGKQIVFARAYRHRPYSLGGRTWDNWDACEINADGTEFSRLTNASYYQMFRITPRDDGSILYAADSLALGNAPPAALFSCDPGKEPQRLIPEAARGETNVHAWASDPIVAPDDSTLAFCSDRERPFWYDVCVLTTDGETKGLVGNKSRYNRYPDLFPDGKRLVFLAGTTFSRGNQPIYSLWEVTLAGQTNELASSDLFTNPTQWLAAENADSQGREALERGGPSSEE